MNTRHRNGILGSFRCAGEGLVLAFRTQLHFRFHLAAAAAVVVVGAWLALPGTTMAILVLVIGAVLFAELVNTAFEVLVDLVSPEYHPLAKQVKDLAAAAVLTLAMISVVIGLLLIGPPLLAQLGLGRP